MLKIRRVLPLVIFLIICSLNVFGWGTTGHRTIAEIAERNLSHKARKSVKKLLDKQKMSYWANWADFIKSDTTSRWDHTHIWHFVNAPKGGTYEEYISSICNASQENLYSAISQLKGTLQNKKNSKEERQEALVFLIHLIGDLHQPMHVGREEDRGGNAIKISWFNRNTNLHSLWDSGLIDFEKYSYSEYATHLNVLNKQEKKKIQEGTLEDWLYDSHLVADQLYAMTKPGENLSFHYFYKVSPILNNQLQKAGLRLAKFLNDLF